MAERVLGLLFAVAGLTLLAGCPPRPLELRYESAANDLRRLQDNYARIDAPLYATGRTDISFREDGVTRRFLGHPATLIFAPPRCLYLSIKSALGPELARLGANDARYWFWVDTDQQRKLWWGEWRGDMAQLRSDVPIRPDRLLDALLLDAPPAAVDPRGVKALLVVRTAGDPQPTLLFQQLDAQGWPRVVRSIRLSSDTQRLPVEIVDFDEGGRPVMRSQVARWRAIADAGPDAVLIPHEYRIRWPQEGAACDLYFDDVRYRTKDTPFCDFPDQFDGQIERLDGSAGSALSRNAL